MKGEDFLAFEKESDFLRAHERPGRMGYRLDSVEEVFRALVEAARMHDRLVVGRANDGRFYAGIAEVRVVGAEERVTVTPLARLLSAAEANRLDGFSLVAVSDSPLEEFAERVDGGDALATGN